MAATKKFYGLNVLRTTTPWPLLTPFGSYRFWDNGCRWPIINPQNNVWNFKPIDNWTKILVANGMLDCIFELSCTPTWASQNPGITNCNYNPGGCAPPMGLNPDGSGSNQLWRKWVAGVSTHLAASGVKVSGFGIWNEFGRQPGKQGVTLLSWTGTNQQLVRMTEDARAIIRGQGTITATKETAAQVLESVGLSAPTSPSSLILSPSIGTEGAVTQIWGSFITTPGALSACDVFAVHTYQINPVILEEQLAAFIAANSQYNKPIWSSEGGWGEVTPVDPGGYVTSYINTMRSSGLHRFYWYAYDNVEWGLLWMKSGLTLAGEAYKAEAEANL